MWAELIKLWKANGLLQEAWNQSFKMLEICHEMFNESVRVLRETDGKDVTESVRRKDITVNKFEREVRRKI